MNIGGVITGRAGVTTMTQTSATLGEQFYANGGWNTIAFAIIVCGIMAAFSAVLLYGSFLLVSRGVLLVFLMVSSSVAFASRILPAWKTASYGWDKWLKTLIDAAVFGPLLTFLLWVSLTLLGSASPKGGVGAAIENGIRANGTNGGSWDSLMVSLFTIAFLYISIKVAHEMANKISGFSTAAKVPGFGVGLAGLASSAFLTRTLGIGAAGLGKRWEDKSKDQNKSVLSRQLYSFGAQRAKGVAGSDMNFANSKAAQSATHGTSNFIPDGGGTSGRRDEKAKRAASRAEAMEPSDEQKAAAASGAINAKRAGQAPERTTYEQNTRAAKADLKNLQEQRQDAIKEFERQERAHNKMISEAIASGDTAQEQAHRARLTQITSQHKGSLQQQDQRIEEAHETVKYHEAHTENLNRDLRSVGEKAVENMSAPALAKQIVANSRPIRAFGLRGPAKDDVVANAAAKQARSSDGPKVRSVLNSIVTKPSNP